MIKKIFAVLFMGFALSLHANEEVSKKTVLLAILARDKAHVLPKFLDCIENLDYDKKLISVYINTNNNQDNTLEILKTWAQNNEQNYNAIIFKEHNIENVTWYRPHEWTIERFHILGMIRQESMETTKTLNCDYYFVVDCDNFITPITLKALINHNKPIAAPLLFAVPEQFDFYSNYFYEIDETGYFKPHPTYCDILFRKEVGAFAVPVVHCTYLVQASVIDKLTYVDGSVDYEFVVFSRSAREHGIEQYICNDQNYGYLLHFFDQPSLEEEKERVANLPYLQVP
jgi:hypothetical protein